MGGTRSGWIDSVAEGPGYVYRRRRRGARWDRLGWCVCSECCAGWWTRRGVRLSRCWWGIFPRRFAHSVNYHRVGGRTPVPGRVGPSSMRGRHHDWGWLEDSEGPGRRAKWAKIGRMTRALAARRGNRDRTSQGQAGPLSSQRGAARQP